MIDEVIAMIAEKAGSGTVPGPDASFQVHLNGEGGGDFHVKIVGGKVVAGKGTTANPGMTISTSVSDFQALVERRADPMSLYFSGKIKVDGNLGLAFRLKDLL
ncbi:MAG: SCP2 sterol-binding domain-containing protein [Bacillota bacterium]|nr:SCP2 sterol-binding domain-containing protein [Bacillota bacterium]